MVGIAQVEARNPLLPEFVRPDADPGRIVAWPALVSNWQVDLLWRMRDEQDLAGFAAAGQHLEGKTFPR
jgi:hypothetical protein